MKWLTPDFHYTDEQWAAISRELSRIGFNADTDITIEWAPFKASDQRRSHTMSVREQLEHEVTGYFLGLELDGQFAPKVKSVRRLMHKLHALRGPLENFDDADEDGGVSREFGDLIDDLNEFEEWINDFYDSDHNTWHALAEKLLFIYVVICAKASPNTLPRYKVGNTSGPTVGFVYKAISPALKGKRVITKDAVQKVIKRLQNKEIVAAYCAGEEALNYHVGNEPVEEVDKTGS
jgi:hypothetical protein